MMVAIRCALAVTAGIIDRGERAVQETAINVRDKRETLARWCTVTVPDFEWTLATCPATSYPDSTLVAPRSVTKPSPLASRIAPSFHSRRVASGFP